MFRLIRLNLVLVAISWIFHAADAEARSPSTIVYASRVGAALDSDLRKGGGTDDTAILQRALDQGKDGRGVHLIVDGPALIRGLDVYSRTTIECTAGGGFFLADNSPRAILRNAHRTRDVVKDQYITIKGCFIHGNRHGQDPVGPASSDHRIAVDPEGNFRSGLQFLGVHNLTLQNLTLWDTLSWGAWIANAKFIHIDDVTIQRDVSPFPEGADNAGIKAWFRKNVFGAVAGVVKGNGADDALHFNGPIQYLTIDNVKIRVWDDGIALNANDYGEDDVTPNNKMGPYVGQGPITDVAISNVIFMDTHHAIKLLSSNQRIDRIVVQNVTGTIRERMVAIGPFGGQSGGNIGSVTFSNVNVELGKFPSLPELLSEYNLQKHLDDEYSAAAAGKQPVTDHGEEWEVPLFALNGRIENLNLNQISVKVVDRGRPIIRVGHRGDVHVMNVDMTILDPEAQSIPVKLMGSVERLNLSLDWPGKIPIVDKGGHIGQLNMRRTPFYFAK